MNARDPASSKRGVRTYKTQGRIRTGCISCQYRGIKCSQGNPQCAKYSSDEWTSNRPRQYPDLQNVEDVEDAEDVEVIRASSSSESSPLEIINPALTWDKRTWRERNSFDFYMRLTSPQLGCSQPLHMRFWGLAIPQAATHEPAILDIVTALGALHGTVVLSDNKQRSSHALEAAMALRLCNRAIHALIRPQSVDPGVLVTVCVLISVFEAMQGRIEDAVAHGTQCAKLLGQCEDAGGAASNTVVPFAVLKPIVRHMAMRTRAGPDAVRYGIQQRKLFQSLEAYHGHGTIHWTLSHNIEFQSLVEAHDTLHSLLCHIKAYAKEKTKVSTVDSRSPTQLYDHDTTAKHLAQWEKSLTALLASKQGSILPKHVRFARLLKANHLYAGILFSVDTNPPMPYRRFYDGLLALIALATLVLDDKSSDSSPVIPDAETTSSDERLDLYEPLFFAKWYCADEQLRLKATTLLCSFPGHVFVQENG